MAAPLSWNDPMFSGVTTSNSVWLPNGGTISNKSITDTGDTASVGGGGSFTIDDVRISSQEGVRIGGSGTVNINDSYIETTGLAGDHSDGIQAYAPGGKGNVTITNSMIVSHNHDATAGMFIADQYYGTFTLNNVVFDGGPYGLRIGNDAGAGHDQYVALKDVYFIQGSFEYAPFIFEPVNGAIHITQWDNVRWATIVNGQLVPGSLIAPPQTVEGSSAPSTPITPTSPGAPTIASFSTDSGVAGDRITNDSTLELKGSAAAGSTVKIYDGTTQIGSTTASSTGGWDYITSVLKDATHALKATATNASGQISTASSALTLTVDTKSPAAPTIASDTINSTNHVLLSGNAEPNSSIKIFDGTSQVGTATSDASGAWNVTTSALSTGSHPLTATATDAAGNVSAASSALDPVIGSSSGSTGGSNPVTPPVTADTVAPDAPALLSHSTIHKNHELVSGTAEAGSTVKLYEGTKLLGTATAGDDGHFSVTTSALNHGTHTFVATATDEAGNTSARSLPLDPAIGSHGTHSTGGSAASTAGAATVDATAPTVELSGIHHHWGHTATINGTADANSQIKVFEGDSAVGTTTANAQGVWHFSTSSAPSHAVHTYKAQQLDDGGHVAASSGNAILGSRGGDTLIGTATNDVLSGNGGHDTFVFAPNFGHDTIQDFGTGGRSHDVLQFSKSVFDSFADVLAHASQSGHDAIISAGTGGSLTLKNVSVDALHKTDFHFA